MSEDTREGVLSFRAISYSCRCTKNFLQNLLFQWVVRSNCVILKAIVL